MNAFVNGEADAYAKRNAGRFCIEPWFLGMLQTIQFRSVIDMGGGDGERVDAIRHGIPGIRRAVSVDAKHGQSFDAGELAMVYDCNVEGYNGENVDLIIFSYVLHWMPNAERTLLQRMSDAQYILINDFYPPYAIDNPYAHCEGVITRKRRYGLICAEAGWIRHIAMEYRYHNEADGEACCCEIWRKP